MKFLKKLLGNENKKILKELHPLVDKINAIESEFTKLSDEQLQAKTTEFKNRIAKGETLDDILVEAFATVREAAKRVLDMRPYDVQLIGGIVMHQGMIAEMRTGEGKTLVATLPTYLNALEGNGVHVITVNDYLAKRDAVWMGRVYDYLGLSVGIIQNQRLSFVFDKDIEVDVNEEDETGSFKVEDSFIREATRRESYRCDITYGTNNEFGFDYLRDNMVQHIKDMVMRPGHEMNFAIIDEVDSILIDEARTPLIISAQAEEATDNYYKFAKLVTRLQENEDYNLDEKLRSSTLTEQGIAKFESWLGVENLYVEGGMQLVHHIEQALRAEVLYKCDKDYVVEKEGEVVIIDEFTGRKMPGRRYSEGLHQAIEAKENVAIQRESRTLATITFQNLFRMYTKLSGMTGTAATEDEEFIKIYDLSVIVIPTNKPDARIDRPDRIYRTEKAKFKAIAEKIKESRAKGQPILIGTISVEKNEELSNYLENKGIEHNALNAKNHEREGEIVAQAGAPGSVTLATNMAGRGVDIKLGGVPHDPETEDNVIKAGGLFVLGTERHESRRIDNQLRGRSARQGDPGETQFFISTDDDLMRVFAGDKLKTVMTRLKVPEDMPIEQKMITRILESSQEKVEGHHFDIRKHVLQYDDVLNRQREVIYKKRRTILELAEGNEVVALPSEKTSENDEMVFTSLKDMTMAMVEQEIELVVAMHTAQEEKEDWNMQEIFETVRTIFPVSDEVKQELLSKKAGEEKLEEVKVRDEIVSLVFGEAAKAYEELEAQVKKSAKNEEDVGGIIRSIEKSILLRAIDILWVDHLVALSHLRTGIGLQGYGQRDPLIEYKKESYHLFNNLIASIQKEVVYSFFKVNIGLQFAPSIMASSKMTMQGAKKGTSSSTSGNTQALPESGEKKVGRNEPCPCGSGKKYKKCHGK